MSVEYKSVTFVPTSELTEEEKALGIHRAFVSVTAVEDRVKDIIEPGAYTKTIKQRTPKGVWSHDWKLPIAKALEIEEMKPGDPRLPERVRLAGGGGVFVKMQFNLESERGRQAYEDVLFFGEDQEWSIGYTATKSWKDRQGRRHITELDWYEFSPVLFGAAPLARSVKSLQEALDRGEELSEADLLLWEQAKLYLDEADLEFKSLVDVEDKFAESRKDDGANIEAGSITTSEVEEKLDTHPGDHHDNARALIRWYEHGEGAAKIRWGTPGDFDRCVRIAADHMTRDQAKGFCNLRHKGALGIYPAQHKAEPFEVGLAEYEATLGGD